MRASGEENVLRNTAAGAAVGLLATWLVVRVLGSRQRAVLLASGALLGALRAQRAVRRGQGLGIALLATFGAAATAALRRSG
jgi:hypothetical protein